MKNTRQAGEALSGRAVLQGSLAGASLHAFVWPADFSCG